MSKFYRIKDICEMLHVARRTVLYWIERGELKAYKLGAGRRLWRIREHDLQVFIKAGQSKSPKV